MSTVRPSQLADLIEPTGRRRPKRAWWDVWRPAGYRFSRPRSHTIGFNGSSWLVEVPAGYEFDLSAPWYVRWALPRQHMLLASGFHDFARTRLDWSLWFSNLLFLDVMHASNVQEPALTLSWLAVRTNRNRG